MESELKLMQAQIEPHFLFNTLASVQFLTETDPPQASRFSATCCRICAPRCRR
jgi:LytS/YehU family sensor histidine kinase